MPDMIDNTATVYDMRVEDMRSPVGIDDTTPVFSWKTNSNILGWAQSAYQLVVKKRDAVVWDSGKVESDASVGIVYAGEPLVSSTEYTWQVTVFNHKGEKKTSDTVTFETGLFCARPFGNAKWISYEKAPLYTGTKYSIDFDFVIHRDNLGFCFGMQDAGSFVMWQINTYNGKNGDGKVYLRPHVKSNGNWTAYPGGPGNLQAIDVTAAVGYSASELIGKTAHISIEVDGRTVKTYLGKSADALTLASTYTHSTNIPLYDIGFRHSTQSGNDHEVASYDNIAVKDADGKLLYENTFTSDTIDFTGAAPITIENGMLRVGTDMAAGEFIFTRMVKNSLPAFRKEVSVKENLVSAKLYPSGLGVYEAYINGERVGRRHVDGSVEYHELKPGFTEMEDRKFYNSYDVTWMIKKGDTNTLAAVVSGGWWSDDAARRYGKNNAFLAKLILTYADGSTETVVTDSTWKTACASAVVYADIFTGETYDARVSQDFMKTGFDDSDWANASINNEFRGKLVAWSGSFITVRKDLERKVESVTVYKGANGASATAYGTINTIAAYGNETFTLNPGETAVIDFGQNFAGWEAIKVEGPAGARLTMEHGEILNDKNGEKSRGNDGPEGSIYNANYRTAKATTVYTLSGKGVEEYHPSFTFYGFRYLSITATQTVTIHALSAQVVTSVEKETGFMTTSDKDINRLISNIRWGQYSNYLSVPTDCPQRDERQGWTADTQVFAETGCYMAFSKSFLEKFMIDMRDSQNSEGAYPGTAPTGAYSGAGWGGLGWADAGIIVPYQLYMMYGDPSVILENWDSMQFYIDGYLSKTNKKGPGGNWGDWLAYESNDDEIKAMLGVAFYAWDALMMADMAEAIGLTAEAARYRALYEEEKAYFIEQYVASSGALKRSEQTVCLYALYLDLLPDEKSVEKVTAQLVRNITSKGNRLQTGFLGTAILLPTLTKIGRSDLAYTLLLQHDNPSWLYSVDQGATTIWERWNSYTIESGFGDVGMNSFNHYAYGSVAGWMFESMAGIAADPQNPGFKNVLIAPQPDSRLAFEASYDSAYGTIKAKSSYEGDAWTYSFTIPANTTATVSLPVKNATINGKVLNALTMKEDGIALVSFENGVATLSAVAGSFTVNATSPEWRG
ncbi:MAG: family 78 glycoside hydrolase catalytic domain [Clostridia bacterium]|nr:family 78 glycoside hydrolase catalytic domain [Clostridia bacterium]